MERPQRVRERLLEAAFQVLAAEGIHALTQTRVADRAGLRQSHLTYYFPTRNELLKAIVAHVAGQGPGMIKGDTDSLPPTLGALKAHLGDRITDARMARVMLALTTASDEDPSLKRWMVEFDEQMRGMFGALLATMGYQCSPQELALFHATMVGTAVLHSSEGTEESAREARELVGLAFDRLVASARRA
jgi:AcrR family transcriptional regulator